MSRIIPCLLAVLIIAIQWPLWLGQGGWLRVRELEDRLAQQSRHNTHLMARNAKLSAEVSNLRDGTEAIEERARYELGMIGVDEIFIQMVHPRSGDGPSVTATR